LFVVACKQRTLQENNSQFCHLSEKEHQQQASSSSKRKKFLKMNKEKRYKRKVRKERASEETY
jgi:hypothetical protein